MNDFLGLMGNWHFWVLIGGYWAFSNAVSSMPLPDPSSSKFYGWFFKFANGFAANLARATAGKIPGTEGMVQQEANK